jgi:hypothetical protein
MAARARSAARRIARPVGATAYRGGGADQSVRRAVPFVVAATIAALLILGIALVPAYVVPWYGMSIVLEHHRQHFIVVGGMTLFGAGVFFTRIL